MGGGHQIDFQILVKMIMNELKKSYYDLLNPKPVWPMKIIRVNSIYKTMSRTIRNGSECHKNSLKNKLLKIAYEFDNKDKYLIKSQSDFDQWLFSKIEFLMEIEFDWIDASFNLRKNIELGLAQKFINLMLKDWWCIKSQTDVMNPVFLHAPFDNIIWSALIKRGLGKFPSLRKGGYYVNLSKKDYEEYQKILISEKLRTKINFSKELIRIEIEQYLWSSSMIQ